MDAEFDVLLSSIARQRDEWQRRAQLAEVALRRCSDDSKDLLRTPDHDSDWVRENILLAEQALTQLNAPIRTSVVS